MDLTSLSLIIVGIALVFSLLVFATRARAFLQLSRPADLASPKGNPTLGILYAYTLGMAPWAKEATRRHWLAYLRGVAFHLGILMGFIILLGSPWFSKMDYSFRLFLATTSAFGAVLGLAGLAARFMESNLRKLSIPDDYFAVILVSLFLMTASLGMLIPTVLPLFYVISALLFIYAPYSKIRHCLYYAFSRQFFGKFFGSRNILPHQHPRSRASTSR